MNALLPAFAQPANAAAVFSDAPREQASNEAPPSPRREPDTPPAAAPSPKGQPRSPDAEAPPALTDTVTSRPRRINPWRLFNGAMVPNWLLCRREISQGAKLCYARLAQFAGREGRCFPKQDTLASELGISDRMARGYLRELAEFDLVEAEQRGLGTSNSYYFLDHPWMHEDQPDASGPSGPDRQFASGPERQFASRPIGEKNQSEKNQRKRETHTPRASGLPQSEQEAAEVARSLGVPEDFARTEYNRMEAVGWMDGCQRAVRSWPHYLKQRWSKDQSQRAERAAKTPPKAGNQSSRRVFELKEQFEAVEARLKEHSSLCADGDVTAEEREEYRVLRRQREMLLQQLSGVP